MGVASQGVRNNRYEEGTVPFPQHLPPSPQLGVKADQGFKASLGLTDLVLERSGKPEDLGAL